MYNLVFIGSPGSGKGTHSDRLGKKLGLAHISTGDLYLREIASDSALGRKAQEILKNGQLAPDEMTATLLRQRLAQPDITKGIILDGFPRTLPQVGILDEIFRLRGEKVDLVILLDISDEAIIHRLVDRRVCSKCHKSYHLRHNPPLREGCCDGCGAPLYQRSDDNPETIRTRLQVFHSQTEPILECYQKRNILIEINSDEIVDVVYRNIKAAVCKRLAIK